MSEEEKDETKDTTEEEDETTEQNEEQDEEDTEDNDDDNEVTAEAYEESVTRSDKLLAIIASMDSELAEKIEDELNFVVRIGDAYVYRSSSGTKSNNGKVKGRRGKRSGSRRGTQDKPKSIGELSDKEFDALLERENVFGATKS